MDESEFYEIVRKQLGQIPTFRKSSAYMYDQLMGFYHAVSWSQEKWLLAILACHVLVFLVVVLARSYHKLQALIFALATLVVFSAERLNQQAGERWQEFSTQNYFDKHGVFVGVVLAAPLLIILTIQLLLTLSDASKLMVKVKRHELGIEKASSANKDTGKEKTN